MTESKNYQYKNTDIAYEKVGEGKPLVILHGWGASGELMLPLARRLSHLRTCYILDLPGFGSSSAPGTPWSIDDFADLIESFSLELPDDTVDYLAHSFGGRIMLKLCSRNFGKTTAGKILLTGGAGMKPERDLSYYVRRIAAKLLKAPFYLLPRNSRERLLQKLRQTALWRSLGSTDYQKLSGVMRETFVKTVTEHLESTLPEIDNEILLLWGENDTATPLYQARRMDKGLKNSALVVIENAGHYAFLDRPEHFASIAEAFFRGK